CQQDYNPPYNF
nr:immunoglobulin light chain junction region [Macaca mulatta]MOX27178.1 immunoglobulin light chain junction region [Macaca mulatta]